MSTKTALQKTVKGILYTVEEESHEHDSSEKNKIQNGNR
jgi:hypothetical protein